MITEVFYVVRGQFWQCHAFMSIFLDLNFPFIESCCVTCITASVWWFGDVQWSIYKVLFMMAFVPGQFFFQNLGMKPTLHINLSMLHLLRLTSLNIGFIMRESQLLKCLGFRIKFSSVMMMDSVVCSLIIHIIYTRFQTTSWITILHMNPV